MTGRATFMTLRGKLNT